MKRSTPTDPANREEVPFGPGNGGPGLGVRDFWTPYLSGWLGYSGLIVVMGRVEGGNPLQIALATLPVFLMSLPLAEWRRRSPRRESGLLKAILVHLSVGLAFAVPAAAVTRLFMNTFLPGLPEGSPPKPQPDFWSLLVMAGFLYVPQAFFFEWTTLSRRMRVARERAARESVLRARAEAKAVRARFNPHFVFNTLHSLLLLVRSDPGTAEKAIEDVADLIRYASVLDRKEQDVVTLGQELAISRKYLELEALRLEDRLRVEWEIAPELEGCMVPALSLQILLENAIKHGLSPKAFGGTVRISAEVAEGTLLVQVRDDGLGAEAGEVEKARDRGLSLLRQRIALLHGERGGVSWITSPGQGFSVTMTVPVGETRKDGEGVGPHG